MMTLEEQQKNRKKELSIIKASNEMLEQAKQNIINNGLGDESIIKQITAAQEENLSYAKQRHGASKEEVAQSRYHGASVEWVKKYNRRLESRGLSDEMLHQKAMATTSVTTSANSPLKKKRVQGVGKVDDNAKIETNENYEPIVKNVPEQPKKRRVRKTSKKTEEEEKNTAIPDMTNEDKQPETDTEIGLIEEAKPEATEIASGAGSRVPQKGDETYSLEELNIGDIPDYVQYDIIPLPSNGECYPHKKGRIPVAYLTASDENIIASPNMYRDGKILDVLLRRKILDKSINVDDLCEGDRDAIILWLRATAYGDDYPIVVNNPNTGNRLETSVKLSDFKYDEFTLKGDENGCFEYKTKNGDILKFKYFTHNQENELMTLISNEVTDTNKTAIIKSLGEIRDSLTYVNLEDEEISNINEDLEEIASIIGNNFVKKIDNVYTTIVTKRMIMHTYSVNGKTDREYIKAFIENMRTNEAASYRNYITDNKPGVNFNFTVNVPESEGGGSFATFLRLEDTIFLNT